MDWLKALRFGPSDGLEAIDTSSIAPRLDSFGNPLAQVGARPGLLSMEGMLGSVDPATGVKTNGWGGLALNSAQALGGAWMGMKQYGMAKDQLKFQKQAFNKNYAAQRQTLNTQLEDRQRARVASNPGAYESVSSYLDKNRIN